MPLPSQWSLRTARLVSAANFVAVVVGLIVAVLLRRTAGPIGFIAIFGVVAYAVWSRHVIARHSIEAVAEADLRTRRRRAS